MSKASEDGDVLKARLLSLQKDRWADLLSSESSSMPVLTNLARGTSSFAGLTAQIWGNKSSSKIAKETTNVKIINNIRNRDQIHTDETGKTTDSRLRYKICRNNATQGRKLTLEASLNLAAQGGESTVTKRGLDVGSRSQSDSEAHRAVKSIKAVVKACSGFKGVVFSEQNSNLDQEKGLNDSQDFDEERKTPLMRDLSKLLHLCRNQRSPLSVDFVKKQNSLKR